MKASIIICTYNRQNLLRDSIVSVQALDFPPDQFEVVVVDNNSSDETANIVREIATVSPVKIKYVFEAEQGLAFARNRGIENASGEILVFTDDDIVADSDWLRELLYAFDSPNVACAGGPIRPIWPFEKPSWINSDWLTDPLSISEFVTARETGYFTDNYPFGANIAFRRDVFVQFGRFPVGLGRQAGNLLSNEEIELCQKIQAVGNLLRFAPKAIIHHRISPDRLTKQWFYRRFYWQGRSDAVLDTNLGRDVYKNIRHCAASISGSSLNRGHVIFADKCRNRWAKGYLHQALFPIKTGINGNSLRPMRALEILFVLIKDSSTSSENLADISKDKEILRLEEQISALLTSSSWRLTSPLRAIGRKLRNEK